MYLFEVLFNLRLIFIDGSEPGDIHEHICFESFSNVCCSHVRFYREIKNERMEDFSFEILHLSGIF